MIKGTHLVILVALSLNIVFASTSDAKIGYDVSARVNSSSWSIERSTQVLSFDMTGSVSGYGSFSKLTRIQEFAGIESNEFSSSATGYLNYDELLGLRSSEGPVIITAKLKSGTNDSINESLTVSGEDFAKIDIDERWPSRFSNYKKISYLGPGIRTRESYENNGDVVATSVTSWKLTKESIYLAQINRSVTSVNITSNDVEERTYTNKSSRYGLNLKTTGESTNLDVIRLDESGDPFLRITQDYFGEQNMTLNLNMSGWVPPEEEETEWLECCRSAEEEICDRTPSIQSFFG